MAKEKFSYECRDCDCAFESDVETNQCYWCKKKNYLDLVDYQSPNEMYDFSIIDLTPKTVGAWAEKNTTIGKQQALEERKIKEQEAKDLKTEEKFGIKPYRNKSKPKKQFWQKDDKPLNLDKIKDVNKYILKGDKN